jgi:hypothetical protein
LAGDYFYRGQSEFLDAPQLNLGESTGAAKIVQFAMESFDGIVIVKTSGKQRLSGDIDLFRIHTVNLRPLLDK